VPICSLFDITPEGFQNIGDYSVFKSSIKYIDFSTDNYFF
jgi:WD40 repeat protein